MKFNALYPVALEQSGHERLAIQWSDGHRAYYGVENLRKQCGCAGCVDELSGERRTQTLSSKGFQPQHIRTVGRYALQIEWADGHAFGYYPFSKLRELCECAQCQPLIKNQSL